MQPHPLVYGREIVDRAAQFQIDPQLHRIAVNKQAHTFFGRFDMRIEKVDGGEIDGMPCDRNGVQFEFAATLHAFEVDCFEYFFKFVGMIIIENLPKLRLSFSDEKAFGIRLRLIRCGNEIHCGVQPALRFQIEFQIIIAAHVHVEIEGIRFALGKRFCCAFRPQLCKLHFHLRLIFGPRSGRSRLCFTASRKQRKRQAEPERHTGQFF